jgi:hypothetical protein
MFLPEPSYQLPASGYRLAPSAFATLEATGRCGWKREAGSWNLEAGS